MDDYLHDPMLAEFLTRPGVVPDTASASMAELRTHRNVAAATWRDLRIQNAPNEKA